MAKSTKSARTVGENPVIAGRVSPDLHKRIKDSAKAWGRSMSEELAFRAEQAFNFEAGFGKTMKCNITNSSNNGAALMNDADDSPVLISMKEACRITSHSRSTINRMRKDGTFPKAVLLGDKRVAFVRSEVVAYVRNLITARDVGS